jgi:hypothetical protein
MKRLRYILASGFVTIAAVATSFALPPEQAHAEATTSFGQTILSPSCYDAVVVNEAAGTADYIAVYDCQIQR